MITIYRIMHCLNDSTVYTLRFAIIEFYELVVSKRLVSFILKYFERTLSK